MSHQLTITVSRTFKGSEHILFVSQGAEMPLLIVNVDIIFFYVKLCVAQQNISEVKMCFQSLLLMRTCSCLNFH